MLLNQTAKKTLLPIATVKNNAMNQSLCLATVMMLLCNVLNITEFIAKGNKHGSCVE